jgi:hypothetical protein
MAAEVLGNDIIAAAGDGDAEVTEEMEPPEMKHDDKFGEEVSVEEANFARQSVMALVRPTGTKAWP